MRSWVRTLSTAGREKKFLAELVETPAALATSSIVGRSRRPADSATVRPLSAPTLPNLKIHGEWAGGSTRAEPGPSSADGWRSGGGLQGDRVAQRLQLADVVALAAVGVDAGVVEARAQIVEAGIRVRQQVPDDDQDGAADRDDGLLGAAAAGDAPVALAEEGVGLAGGRGGLAQHPGQVGVAVPGGGLAFLLAGRLLDAGRKPGPGDQMASGREAAHVHAELGDEHLRGSPADPGDLIQPIGRRLKRGDLGLDVRLQHGDVG